MGLVQNLRKKFSSWVDRTLAELSSAYITQLAKQTTKKQDNSSVTTSSLKPWAMEHQHTTTATSSPDTSKRTILEETDEEVANIKQWAKKNRAETMAIGETDNVKQEIEEWLQEQAEDEGDVKRDEVAQYKKTYVDI